MERRRCLAGASSSDNNLCLGFTTFTAIFFNLFDELLSLLVLDFAKDDVLAYASIGQ